MHSVWFFSLRRVNGYWEVLSSGPVCHILALEEGLKAILHIFKARYGDTHLCACNYLHASNAGCSITAGCSISGAILVRLALENEMLSGDRGAACSAVKGE